MITWFGLQSLKMYYKNLSTSLYAQVRYLKKVQHVQKMGAWLLRIIAPPFCCRCKMVVHERNAYCAECFDQIKPLVSTNVTITKKYNMRIFCVGAYQEPLKTVILAKSRADRVACWYMAQLIYHHSLFTYLDVDILVPIPLHWRRYAKRGYNQAAVVAFYLSRWSGIPVRHLLKRTRATPFQSKVSKQERFVNVQDVFQLNLSEQEKHELKGKKILLVDDLMTTGATLTAAGKQLRRLHPDSMQACVLART